MSTPFIFVSLLIALIDPYNFILSKPVVKSNEKDIAAYHLNTALYKYLDYKNDPKKYVVFGISFQNK